jgi:hypothetical protein
MKDFSTFQVQYLSQHLEESPGVYVIKLFSLTERANKLECWSMAVLPSLVLYFKLGLEPIQVEHLSSAPL